MNGIEILASQEVITEFAFNWMVFCIAFGVTFSIFLAIGFMISLHEGDYGNLLISIILGIMFGAFCGGLSGGTFVIPVSYETQYKCTISDEVLINEFLEKYEIIDQEGKIYTIREKNQEDLQ